MKGSISSNNPKISIITVTYNAANQLEKTIRSVKGQSYSNIEFIVIDGGSTDGTEKVIREYRQVLGKVVSEPDNGIYDAMNKGLENITGDYVAFLNAGDHFCNERSLENIIHSCTFPADIMYGDIVLVDINGGSRHHKALEFTQHNLLKYGTGVLCHQAMLVSTDIVPLYSLKYTYKGELNWYFDILSRKPDLSYYHYKEPIIYYYLGGTGYRNFIKNRLEWYRLLIYRFGLRSVFNAQFLGFIYRDFRNRYFCAN